MDFDEKLEEVYRMEVAGRGDCPAPDVLVRFHADELSSEERAGVQRHLEVCGSCDWTLAELSGFDSAAASAEREIGLSQRLMRFFLHPALAYAIALALVYPAYRGISQTGRAPKIADGAASVRDFDLGDGSVTRSTSSSTRAQVVLSGDERFFLLTFFVPVRKDRRYAMEIRNEKGAVVDSNDIQSRDSIGNFTIVATSNRFPDGNYTMAITENEIGGKITNEYTFNFRIERKSD